MKTIEIGDNHFLNKKIRKVRFLPGELPKIQTFNSDDIIIGNPNSPTAICFIYTWHLDAPPKEIKDLAVRLSNYAAITGFWRTTNGGRYALSNILANPNINKVLLLVFGAKDNGHLLAEALVNFWKSGVNDDGIIIDSKSPNPRFEQVPKEGLERIRAQADLAVLRWIKDEDFQKVEKIVHAFIQEPKNAVPVAEFVGLEFYSSTIKNNMLYDDGARFDVPFVNDLSSSAKNVIFEEKSLVSSVGQSIQARNLEDASELAASFIFKNGSPFIDQRGILNIESRSFTLTVLDPLEVIPKNFDKIYIQRYVDEFMEGKGELLSEFNYTYHDRIFVKWGNQVEKAIEVLKKSPNTRRCLISLWDPKDDLSNPSAPCLDFIWLTIKGGVLELHATYRSQHLATVTKDGKLMNGEGALVPNLYALGTLQKYVSEKTGMKRGPLILNDFSGHLYVSDVK